ncbi:MAG: hypothetical protein ABIF88_00245 [archaeon]
MKKRIEKIWFRETCRDLISLGSIPFFILVLARVYLIHKPDYFSQFLIAGVFFLVFYFIFRYNLYSGLALIVLVFTSLYYDDFTYTIFGSVAYILILGSLFYLKFDWKKILLGVLFGAIGIGIRFLFS